MLIPTFHPAYLLRNPSAKREVWEDMKKVRAILQSATLESAIVSVSNAVSDVSCRLRCRSPRSAC